MRAKYLVRLDDACDTLSKKNWDSIEKIMDKFKIKPIVSVIPENLDSSLHYDTKDKNFWKKVKRWEKKGWSIALHGFNHLFHKVNKKKLIFPYYNTSEFAGLKKNIQCNIIKKAYKKFLKQDIKPKVWVAPRHTFDRHTLEAIKISTDIKVVSDGISFYPYKYKDLIFVPQQLWWPKKRHFGIWTICLHPNTMNKELITKLSQSLTQDNFYKSIATLSEVLSYTQNKSLLDKLFEIIFFNIRAIKKNYVYFYKK
jgi:predicted deacetylase